MNDVAYRLNTGLPVKKFGTSTVNSGGISPVASGGFQFGNTNTKTITNESPAGTGLVNRFDDPTFYTA